MVYSYTVLPSTDMESLPGIASSARAHDPFDLMRVLFRQTVPAEIQRGAAIRKTTFGV